MSAPEHTPLFTYAVGAAILALLACLQIEMSQHTFTLVRFTETSSQNPSIKQSVKQPVRDSVSHLVSCLPVIQLCCYVAVVLSCFHGSIIICL